MNKSFKLKAFSIFTCALLTTGIAMAQSMAPMTPMAPMAPKSAGKPQASPRDSVSGKVAGSEIKIVYGAPSVRGRKIFGGLEPYGKMWRAGANAATTFETSKEIKIGGKSLPAGKYTLFATPGEKEWVITLNSVTGQWGIKRDGSANADPAKDVLTVTVKPIATKELVERMVFKIDKKGFYLVWENTEVPVMIK